MCYTSLTQFTSLLWWALTYVRTNNSIVILSQIICLYLYISGWTILLSEHIPYHHHFHLYNAGILLRVITIYLVVLWQLDLISCICTIFTNNICLAALINMKDVKWKYCEIVFLKYTSIWLNFKDLVIGSKFAERHILFAMLSFIYTARLCADHNWMHPSRHRIARLDICPERTPRLPSPSQ